MEIREISIYYGFVVGMRVVEYWDVNFGGHGSTSI